MNMTDIAGMMLLLTYGLTFILSFIAAYIEDVIEENIDEWIEAYEKNNDKFAGRMITIAKVMRII